MPLPVPTLDDRSFAELVREAKARIPVHNPEWTNFNDSDPGVTLLQLFAFMTESLLYRANQVPEQSRRKFISLLGINQRPAAAARGFVAIRNERGPISVVALDAGLDVRAGAVRFRTTRGLAVLPVEARVFTKRPLPPGDPDDAAARAEEDLYRLLYADLLQTTSPAFYTTAPLPDPTGDAALPAVDIGSDTADRSLWIALLARPGDAPDDVRPKLVGQTLTLGVLPQLSADGLRVAAGAQSAETIAAGLEWRIAAVRGNSVSYETITARTTANPLGEPALVELPLPRELSPWKRFEPGEEGTGDLPPSLADTNLGPRVITWLRMRVPVGLSGAARISWLDINAAEVEQRVPVSGELVGSGSGEPDQRLRLANAPVIADSLRLRVDGEPWERIDDLLAADPEVAIGDQRRPITLAQAALRDRSRVYLLDEATGEVQFGFGAYGTRPRLGATIVADYSFGGGRAGNVGANAITRSPQLPPGFKVVNPVRTWGGDDGEDLAEAERAIPRAVQHRERLVSLQDFADVALRTPGVDMGRVEVLPLYDPVSGLDDVAGLVTVMVVPRFDPQAPDAPMPDGFFLETVCRHLQPRRLITTELHIRGPVYRDLAVAVGVELVGGLAVAPVLEAVKAELRRFLSPLSGGRDGVGWPLDTPLQNRELEAIVARVSGVRLVRELRLARIVDGIASPITDLNLAHLELPRLLSVEAGVGSAPVITPDVSAPGDLTPIPVVPKGC